MKIFNFFLLISLIILVSFSSAYAEPGDGTLPVIRSVEIEFIDGNLSRLPTTVVIDLNVVLKKNQFIRKKIKFPSIHIVQVLKLSNIDGKLQICISSISENSSRKFQSEFHLDLQN